MKAAAKTKGPGQGLYLAVLGRAARAHRPHRDRRAASSCGAAPWPLALGIAAIKSTLVALYFMHLRWEKRLLIRLMLPITLATLAIFIGLTYTDILRR